MLHFFDENCIQTNIQTFPHVNYTRKSLVIVNIKSYYFVLRSIPFQLP